KRPCCWAERNPAHNTGERPKRGGDVEVTLAQPRIIRNEFKPLHAAQFWWQQRGDEFEGEPTGQQSDWRFSIHIHDVVVARVVRHGPRLAACHARAAARLQFQRDMLCDMPDPCSFLEPPDESTGFMVGAAMLL